MRRRYALRLFFFLFSYFVIFLFLSFAKNKKCYRLFGLGKWFFYCRKSRDIKTTKNCHINSRLTASTSFILLVSHIPQGRTIRYIRSQVFLCLFLNIIENEVLCADTYFLTSSFFICVLFAFLVVFFHCFVA